MKTVMSSSFGAGRPAPVFYDPRIDAPAVPQSLRIVMDEQEPDEPQRPPRPNEVVWALVAYLLAFVSVGVLGLYVAEVIR